ncbi:hypothetical protein M2263_000100 [Providencia alcalifaciens]|nr:hypothetical protein [Providencia alcalifaciens]
MIIRQNILTDLEMINKTKSAIKARKYAHSAEISLLWQNAMGSQSITSWPKLMFAACIASALAILFFASVL